MSKEYEFTQEENDRINKFISALRIFAIVLTISGVLTLVDGFASSPSSLTTIVSGISWIAMGISFYLPIDNFQRIVQSEGNDIKELLVGFKEFKTAWLIVIIILVVNRVFNFMDMLTQIGS